MPLAVGKVALESVLLGLYSDVAAVKATPEFARKKAQAIYDFVITGIPMTIITTFPGPVAGAMTAGPVKGLGLGGFDKPAPGIGLAAAKPLLKQELITLYTHGNAPGTPQKFATGMATAVFNYFSQAMIQTMEDTHSPLPAPPPAGPVAGPITGKGGTLSNAQGAGYSSAKAKLESEFIRIWSKTDKEISVEEFATEMSEAIHAFCIEGKINTVGTFVAPAAVAPPPAPPVGAYLPGVGTGTGTVT